MPESRRRQGQTERQPIPALRRPSNPRTVAKAFPPSDRSAGAAGRPVRGKKKRGSRAAPGPLPASVTMSVARVLRGEEPAAEEAPGARPWGVLYRFVVLDADGKPIAPGAYTIRCHLLHQSSSGCFTAREKGARITAVPLDADAGAFDFVGIPDVEPPRAQKSATSRAARKPVPTAEGEERLLEYFSFELQGVTYAIPQSGFVLMRARRGGRLEVVRAPQAASGSVHGAVMPGLVTTGAADAYVLPLPE